MPSCGSCPRGRPTGVGEALRKAESRARAAGVPVVSSDLLRLRAGDRARRHGRRFLFAETICDKATLRERLRRRVETAVPFRAVLP